MAWLAGALVACALIGTCLALLRSDILPFRDAWPSTQGTPTPVSELAPPPAATQPAGNASLTQQPTSPSANGAVLSTMVVELRDGSNNPVAQNGTTVTVAIPLTVVR